MNQATKQDLRQILGTFITGVTVVTTIDQHKIPVGFTANSFTSVSLEPPLVLVCLAQSAGLAAVYRRAESFAINILSTEQEAVSNSFARKDEDRFANIGWQAKSTGSPILDGCAAWLDCTMYEKIIAGDHIILIGQIIDAKKSVHHPLGYYQGQYCSVDLPEETLSKLQARESIHSTAGILVGKQDKLLLIKQKDGQYDVPRAQPGSSSDTAGLKSAMSKLGIDIFDNVLFSIVEGRHHQRLSIYYRCETQSEASFEGAHFFDLNALPLKQLARPYLANVLKRYAKEKQAGQFGIYVGDEHQGFLENNQERKI